VKHRNVELRIEELILHGFEPGDRDRIGEALQRELSQLFTEQGTPPSLTREHAIARLEGGAFDAPSSSEPETVGSRLARSLYGGLSR
jgi:hypothetical protein